MFFRFLIIAILLVVLELIYFRIADKFNIIDKPNERSSHKRIVLRGGGIIFALGTIAWFLFFRYQYPFFVLGLVLIAAISFWDDVKSLPDSVRLIVQFVAIFLMFVEFGILKWDMWWIVLLSWILCVGIINAYNFMDGINGITGGYSLAVLLPLLYLNHHYHFVDNSLIIVTILADLVFCFFNFRKKAKCFAGDVGSITMAFLIVFLLGRLIILTGDFTYILLLAVYGIDSVLTICHRILLHENLGTAHRKHAYQLLSNELKIPHVVVSLIYMIIQLAISIGLIIIPQITLLHWLYFAVVLILLAFVYLVFMRKYYPLHEAYLDSIKQ